MTTIVQYIVLRGDLNWPIGALVAQGAHASIAAISKFMDKEKTKLYLDSLDSMHKVVLKAENEDQLKELAVNLKSSNIDHYCWIEQPENIISCIASAPNDKSVLQPFFKPFKLFK